MTQLRPADGLATCEEGDVLYVAPLPRGPILVLEGPAAIIWRAATTRPRTEIAIAVAADAGTEPEAISEQVDAFVGSLLADGLLTE